MSDDILRSLAAKAGIATHWSDQAGQDRAVSPESLRAILAALGWPAGDDDAMRNTLSALEAGAGAPAARFLTARVGQPLILPYALPDGAPVEIELEGGAQRHVSPELRDGLASLPAFDQPGYHRLLLPDGEVTIAAAPARCVNFADLAQGRPIWGLAAQIYSLRSAGDGGIGHFGGVAALGRKAAALGADALAISPVHALFGVAPERFSPYSPSTRLFLNPLHADPTQVLPAEFVAAALTDLGLGEEMARLEAMALIDWPAATRNRRALLRALFDRLTAPDGPEQPRAAFERFAGEASALLQAHAVFEVLHASEVARDPAAWDWRHWQPALRDPASPEVAEFARAHHGEVQHQLFLQWLTGQSCAEAQRACREAGMAIGLIADLAIGMDGSGSHAWSRQDEVIGGLSVGAPPDYYAAEGQNWGLTTFSPRGLAASGYAPFIETLRANLRYAGGVRIDHVMGMSRLWLIPQGASALEGSYVSFPSETLFRLIALESWRHRAVVIGEDLGTLPDGFRDYLREQGVAGMRVLRFEKQPHGLIPPQEWAPAAAAMTTTHDLIATAGWWVGADLDPGDTERANARAWDRGLAWASFERAGLVSGERPAPEDTDPVIDAAIDYVAASPCALKLVAIEDALGVTTQPNVPGTTTEKPNWRHRLEGEAQALLDPEPVRARLARLGPARSADRV